MKILHNVSASESAMEGLWGLVLALGPAVATGLAERGLTVARAHLLYLLALSGPVTQRALSRELRVTPRNVTGLVDALETDGLVQRMAHPTDRRARLVALTADGRKIAVAMRREQDRFASVLFGGIPEQDLAVFTKVLALVAERVAVTTRSPSR